MSKIWKITIPYNWILDVYIIKIFSDFILAKEKEVVEHSPKMNSNSVCYREFIENGMKSTVDFDALVCCRNIFSHTIFEIVMRKQFINILHSNLFIFPTDFFKYLYTKPHGRVVVCLGQTFHKLFVC